MRGFEMMPTVSIVAIEKKFAIAFRTKDRTGNDSRMEPQGLDRIAHPRAGGVVKLGIANNPAFADFATSDLELRLHQNDHAPRRREQWSDGGDQAGGRI